MPIAISGTGRALPSKILTNQDLEKMVDTTDEWITTRTGIKERRICSVDEATSDLSIRAARAALENAGIEAREIDLIVVATCTPDHFFPSVGCLVQKALGAERAVAFDISAACSGFLYGLAVARGYLLSGMARRALVIGADVLSKFTDWKDRSTCVLFGDGAGALVMEITEKANEDAVLSICLGADGRSADLLTIPGGGARFPLSAKNGQAAVIRMEGAEVFKMAVIKMAEAAEKALALAGKKAEDLALLIPHQANLRIMDAVARRLKFPMEKVFVNVQKYGNMSAATTIIALDEAQREGRIHRGDLVELIAFGAGMTWGAAVIRW